MITGLTFNKIVKVELDRYGKVTVNVDGEEQRISIKEVPYVRYKLDEYTDDALLFVDTIKKLFVHSVHIIDIDIYQGMVQNAVAEKIKNVFDNQVAIFGIININDSVLDNINMLQATLGGITKSLFDRFIIKDGSTRLDNEKFIMLRKYLMTTHGIKDVGLCSSPFTNEDNCCISAERARHLGAIYGSDEVATAVSTHQNHCANGCFCVRSVTITGDLLAKEGTKKAETKEKEPKQPKEKKESKPKKPAKPKIQSVPDEWF